MPNWAINDITFLGNPVLIDKIRSAFSSDHPFQTLYPCPQDLLDTMAGFCGRGTPEQAALEAKEQANLATYGYKNWYDWCCDHWGTKWDARDISISHDSGVSINVRFDTAWSPPIQFLCHLQNEHPRLQISGWYSLEEDGHEIAYNFTIEDGNPVTGEEEELTPDRDEDVYLAWDDPPADCSADTSFRVGSDAKLPLP